MLQAAQTVMDMETLCIANTRNHHVLGTGYAYRFWWDCALNVSSYAAALMLGET